MITSCLFVLAFRKWDVAEVIQQCGKEDHQVRAGRLHIVPPASEATHQPLHPHPICSTHT